jgi:hypothetical protein
MSPATHHMSSMDPYKTDTDEGGSKPGWKLSLVYPT